MRALTKSELIDKVFARHGSLTNREADEIEQHSAASMAATAEVARQARAAAKRKAAGRAAA